MHTVYILDDHDIVRIGLERLIAGSEGLRVVGCASGLGPALAEVPQLRPDLVISDMSMDDSKGLDTVRAMVQAQAGRAVLVVSMHDEMLYGEQVLSLGAQGYLMKENAYAQVLPAARAILAGGRWVSAEMNAHLLSRLRGAPGTARAGAPSAESTLTQREIEVLERLGRGKTTKEIAFDLDISHRTVDIYRANLKRKLSLRTGTELIAYSLART